MQINIDGMNIHYEITGKGSDVLILHGWGTSGALMKPVADVFDNKMRVISLDLPGFGESDEPKTDDYDIYSYSEFVKKFCESVGVENPVIVAHSFGGRIALILAGKNMIKINKMVLTGCAGIKPRRNLVYYVKVYSYKISKKVLNIFDKINPSMLEKFKKKKGSADYAAASDKMRKVLVRTVNEDLKYLLKNISVPTLLVWGEKDDATPLSDGKLMEKLIPDSGLVVMPGSTHYAFLENIGWFANILRSFCSKEMEEQ